MKLKDDTVKVDNLHPLMKKRVAMFDIYHRRITGTDLVITSGNDGKHWGSISVEKRPPGWNEMKEDQIRELSDSLHYEDMAIDIRRWYFDALLPKTKKLFLSALNDLFPKQFFDIVSEKTHFHIEMNDNSEMHETIEKLLENLRDLRYGIFQDTEMVNRLIDEMILLVERIRKAGGLNWAIKEKESIK